ncbi:hypothetical protein KEM55_003490 [Ascosphaera atra]|nr:hypothetical protein KEM55_003490 [Ascosphaera atra]
MEVPMGGAQMAANPSNAGSSSAAVETNNHNSPKGTPAYNAQEQLAFEQQKLEQQQSRRGTETRSVPPYQQGGPTSWEGMYDETPQPSASTQSHSRGTPVQAVPTKTPTPGPKPASTGPPQQPVSAPPANAPTGPRNAGRPGANYRGGGRGGHRGFHPYSRPN